ncbi:MAG: hypothetical protein K8T90_17095 [Planctomycetes bacterium]|nr:hypothetical protein [Planctomycetota bacterium]
MRATLIDRVRARAAAPGSVIRGSQFGQLSTHPECFERLHPGYVPLNGAPGSGSQLKKQGFPFHCDENSAALFKSAEAHATAGRIIALREAHRAQLQGTGKSGANLLRLLDVMYERPILTARVVESRLAVTFPTATSLIHRLEKLGMLHETTGKRWGRRYACRPYLRHFEDSEAADLPATGGGEGVAPRIVTGGDA